MIKKSMNSTEGEAVLTSMTLTVYLDESKNVLSFPLAKLGTTSLYKHFNISSVSEFTCPSCEDLQMSNFRKIFVISHICRWVVVIGLETTCSLFLSISVWVKTNVFSFLPAGLHLSFSQPRYTTEGTKSLNYSLV